MSLTLPSLDHITQLELDLRRAIPETYRDIMDHMNVRWYVGLFDDALDEFFARIGRTSDYRRETNSGGFTLEQHIRYLNEVNIGDTIAVYTRLLGFSANHKRIHFMSFMINETRGKLAATLEEVNSHADLIARTTSPFPPPLAEKIAAFLAANQQLAWEAPICGAMSAR